MFLNPNNQFLADNVDFMLAPGWLTGVAESNDEPVPEFCRVWEAIADHIRRFMMTPMA